MARLRPTVTSDDPMSPEESLGLQRWAYERRRLRGKTLRDAEAKRRKALRPPPTIDEAILDHFATRAVRLRVTPRAEDEELASLEAAYVEAPSAPREPQAAREYGNFLKDNREERGAELRDALALPTEDKLRAYGWLLGIPFDVLDEIPEFLLSAEARPELPAWSLRASYDALRDEFYVGLVQGTVDRAQLDEERQRRGLTAKRATHSDEAKALNKEQRAHLRKLRVRLRTATQFRERLSDSVAPEIKARSDAYVIAAEKAIRDARVAYGLPPEEVPEK